MSEPKNPKSTSTDEKNAAQAEESGHGGKKDAAGQGAAEGAKPAEAAPAAAAPAKAKKEGGKPKTADESVGMDETFFPVSPAKTKARDSHIDHDDEEFLDVREKLVAKGEKRTLAILGSVILTALLVSAVLLAIFLEKRRAELKANDIEPEGAWDMIAHFDVHQQDIVAYKARKAAEEKRAKTPIYGHLRIETDPPQADVYISCIPLDARCNNVGTKENPQWDEHYVKDEELGKKECKSDADCQECTMPAAGSAAPAPAAGTGAATELALAPAGPTCRFPDARCSDGLCRLPMRTAITIQSLFIGTLVGLEKERKYHVRLSKPGWITEEFDVSEENWENKLIPGREDSDRAFRKQIELKAHPCCFPQDLEYCNKNLPVEICKDLEVHLQKVAAGQASCNDAPPEPICKDIMAYLHAKAEYQAAMMKAMEQAQQ